MTNEELILQIHDRTGVPASLLTGETIEENIARAKSILSLKEKYEAEKPKTTAEQFANWIKDQEGIEEQNEGLIALSEIEEAVRIESGGYPIISDGGNALINGVTFEDSRTISEQFAEWFKQCTAFDPYKENGWTRLV